MAPSVLVVGASGTLGVPLVQEFIKQKAKFGRLAILATDASKKARFAEAESGGFEIIVGSLLEASSYKGFEFVISLVGNPLLRLQPAMIELAYSAGVRHFYPSEFGADLYLESAYRSRYFRSKLDTRDQLVATAKAHPDFNYTLLVNGAFLDTVVQFTLDQEKHVISYYGNSDGALHVTSLPDICRYTVESILLPSPAQDRELHVVGEQTSIGGITAVLDRVLGVKHKVIAHDPKIAEQKEREAWKAKDEASSYTWALASYMTSGNVITNGQLANDKFSFKAETVEEAVKRMFGKE